ncbi:MAG: ABC transporter ATP-binding protein [Leucobacter sp.]
MNQHTADAVTHSTDPLGPSATSAGISAVGLSRTFHGVTVVQDASLHVVPGSITALVGPNGSGKTTLMLMLATLLRPDTGTIHINGHDALEEPISARSTLGWMPDALGAWSALTVRETLEVTSKMYGFPRTRTAQRVDKILRETNLESLSHQRTHTLSRGQKQRLSLARALVHAPNVLLLDEPSSGLDPDARRSQRETLVELAAEGAAVLVTSHVLNELEHLASDVVFMTDGRTSMAAKTPGATPHFTDHTPALDLLGSSNSTSGGAASRSAASSGTDLEIDAPVTTAVWRIRSLDPAALETQLTANGYAWKHETAVAGIYSLVELPDEAQAASLLTVLATAGVPLVEFAPVAGAIEQAFTRLTQPTHATGETL